MKMAFDEKGNCVIIREITAIQRKESFDKIESGGGRVFGTIKQKSSLTCLLKSGSQITLEFESDEIMHHEGDVIMEYLEKMED